MSRWTELLAISTLNLQPGVTVKDIVLDHSSRGDMISRFFNTAAFVPTNQVPRGTYGNAGRGPDQRSGVQHQPTSR